MNARRNIVGRRMSELTRLRVVLCSVILLSLVATYWTPPTCVTYAGEATGVYPGKSWQKTATPGQLGWSSEKLAAARAYSEQIGSAAVMIVEDGVVVDAWGDITLKLECHSMRKSLLSALIGIHFEEDHIDLSKTMKELGIDDNEPSLTETEKQATVADLIKARSGIYHPALGESPGMKARRPERHSHAPGTFWYYNNWDFNVLGTIFEQETGTKIFEEFHRRLAKPLQMEDFKVDDCRYLTGDDYDTGELSIHPYYLFRMSARDLARFGLLFLREGRWRNQQIISAQWVRESTASHSRTGPESGYGYMWWTGVRGGLFPHVRVKEHSFYASGFRGHRVIVLPYRKLVIVHRVDTDRRFRASHASVNSGQIGRLLWLILAAAGETDIGEDPSIEAAKGVRLTADNLKETLEGSSIREGASVVSISRDGTMSVSMEGKLIDTGKWWTEGDKFCSQWKKIRESKKACRFLVLDGTILKWFYLDGTLDGKGCFSRE
jgi:CubicO group peptidase (beta-lactamase class C family)